MEINQAIKRERKSDQVDLSVILSDVSDCELTSEPKKRNKNDESIHLSSTEKQLIDITNRK